MEITVRDIEIMGWMPEQKFMTRRQVRQVFWKNLAPKSTEDYRRLSELARAGFLKRAKYDFYKDALYMVTAKGVRELRATGRHRGLCELGDMDYSGYKHDGMVTDIRILFHQWGYSDWISERILSKSYEFRRLPDGVIYHRDRHIAVEYESASKSKNRYRDIFFHYELDEKVSKVLYVVDTLSLLNKLIEITATCSHKLYFVTLNSLKNLQMNSPLQGAREKVSLRELLDC